MSLAHAAEELNRLVERVRQLVVAGDLPGEKLGNAWVVPSEAVPGASAASSPRVDGRSMRVACLEISAAEVDLDRPGRYRRRADVVCCQMSRGDVDEVARHAAAMTGGAAAAAEYGVDPASSNHADIYVARRVFDELSSMVADVSRSIRRGTTPGRRRRDVWDLIPPGAFVPRCAAALDLLDSGNPSLDRCS